MIILKKTLVTPLEKKTVGAKVSLTILNTVGEKSNVVNTNLLPIHKGISSAATTLAVPQWPPNPTTLKDTHSTVEEAKD